jgi:heme/copper-type cytochrome/quinol oxidase subunit 2
MQRKSIGLLLALLLTIFTMVACSTDNKKEEATKSDDKTEETVAPAKSDSKDVKPTGNVVEVTINAKNFEFDVKEIKAKVGDTVKIHFVNADGGHGFGLDEYDVKAIGGETVEFMVTEAGESTYYCSIMCGHGHDLMEGTLIVE